MASIRKRGDYQWEARIRRKGYPVQSRTFETKQEALAWAAVIESEMTRGVFVSRAEAERTSLRDLLERYAQEITPNKKGAKTELQRIDLLLRDELAVRIVASIQSKDIAKFRDRRLKTVSAATVNRDLNLLSHVFTVAIADWGIALPANPVQLIRRPKVTGGGRDRRLQPGEEARLLASCAKVNSWMAPLVQLALDTGMRRGELLSIEWKNVDLENQTVFLPKTKNFESRHVPLSRRAVNLLKSIPRSVDGRVFQLASPNAVTMAFRRACAKAINEKGEPDPITDLRFHDLRHEATSRLFERGLDIMQVASITGHKNMQMLKRYTHLRAEDLAKMLG